MSPSPPLIRNLAEMFDQVLQRAQNPETLAESALPESEESLEAGFMLSPVHLLGRGETPELHSNPTSGRSNLDPIDMDYPTITPPPPLRPIEIASTPVPLVEPRDPSQAIPSFRPNTSCWLSILAFLLLVIAAVAVVLFV